jgi:hypothetical protein
VGGSDSRARILAKKALGAFDQELSLFIGKVAPLRGRVAGRCRCNWQTSEQFLEARRSVNLNDRVLPDDVNSTEDRMIAAVGLTAHSVIAWNLDDSKQLGAVHLDCGNVPVDRRPDGGTSG